MGPLVPLFWISGEVLSGFQSQSGFCLIYTVEAKVMYIPWYLSQVLHLPTSWWSLSQPVTFSRGGSLAQIRMGNQPYRKQKCYQCASDPAFFMLFSFDKWWGYLWLKLKVYGNKFIDLKSCLHLQQWLHNGYYTLPTSWQTVFWGHWMGSYLAQGYYCVAPVRLRHAIPVCIYTTIDHDATWHFI